MTPIRKTLVGLVGAMVWLATGLARGEDGAVPVDLSAYREGGEASVQRDGDRLILIWPVASGESGRLVFSLRPGSPLIASIAVAKGPDEAPTPILVGADPTLLLTVGTREAGKNRPPGMSPFNEFFDNPAQRASQRHEGRLTLTKARVESRGERVTVAMGDLVAGPFRGEWRFTAFPGSRLVQVEAVVTTEEPRCAILYDLGLAWAPTESVRLAWTDATGEPRAEVVPKDAPDRSIAVRHRAAAMGGPEGTLVVSPPPHRFFFSRDFTDNVRTIWTGSAHPGTGGRFGLGIRQDPTGGGNFVPWFNAPPGSQQHLGLFLALSKAEPPAALAEMREYTRGDRFAELPGRVTFTSHYHMAIAEAARKRKAEGKAPDPAPAFVRMFKDMNVQAVHLGEFHGDGHQYDPGPLRLPELEAMFAECRRLSDPDLLLIPGEEVARFFGKGGSGREAGHWMTLFPKPVYWILDRAPDAPFVEDDPRLGKIYRVADARDVQEVLQREGGLAWTAHPRIKSSSWAPDAFRDEPYFRADTWLGAAWKAMPADLSRERLGERGLNLLDDMANWGVRKYLPGEVDVFTLDPTHELYGHMNINYLELDRLPEYETGWAPILDALRGGRFFTTTGEVLIRDFTVGGKRSGGTLSGTRHPVPGNVPTAQAELEWTYPLRFAELVSGDGTNVFRDRVELEETPAFGRSAISFRTDLRGRRWARLEVWDVAGNGAYTQPVWIQPEDR